MGSYNFIHPLTIIAIWLKKPYILKIIYIQRWSRWPPRRKLSFMSRRLYVWKFLQQLHERLHLWRFLWQLHKRLYVWWFLQQLHKRLQLWWFLQQLHDQLPLWGRMSQLQWGLHMRWCKQNLFKLLCLGSCFTPFPGRAIFKLKDL